MTEQDLAEIEARAQEYTDLYPPAEWIMTAVGETLILCAALRVAWTERDTARQIADELVWGYMEDATDETLPKDRHGWLWHPSPYGEHGRAGMGHVTIDWDNAEETLRYVKE